MNNDKLTTDLDPITQFELYLEEGSVMIPCTAITPSNGSVAGELAAAIHHLIQRVAYLESKLEATEKVNAQ